MSERDQFEAKQHLTGDLGQAFDKDMETAISDSLRYSGAADGLVEGTHYLVQIADEVRKGFNAGTFASLDQQGVMKLLLSQVNEIDRKLLALAEQKKMAAFLSNGKAVAFRSVVDTMQRHHNVASARLRQIDAPPDEDDPRDHIDRKSRRPGEHPGHSQISKRKAAEKKPDSKRGAA